MRTTSRALVATLLAMVALAAGATTGGAFTLGTAPGGRISAPSLGKLTFGTSPTIQCSVTLNGTLSEGLVALQTGRQIGTITEVRIANESCSGGTVERVLSLPWPITIKSVPSGLPNEATSMALNVRRVAFLLSTFFGIVNCLYSENGTSIAGGTLALTRTETAGVYRTGLLRADETIQLPRASGNGACPEEGGFRGTFQFNPSQRFTVGPNEFSIGPGGLAEGPITITTPEESETCEMSLNFSFREGFIPLVTGTSVGSVTEARMSCEAERGGRRTFYYFLELLWDISYENRLLPTDEILSSYRGRILRELPNGQKCLYEGRAEILFGPDVYEILSMSIERVTPLDGSRCPSSIEMRGRYRPVRRQTITLR